MNANEYDTKAGQIRQLNGMPPDQLANGLASVHQKLSEVAPNIAPHIHTTAINAIQYLNSKLPNAGNELPMDSEEGPSKAQKSQWLQLHETVNNPLSVLDHVKNGTLGGHHVEAIKTVYPDLHQEMVNKMNEEIGALKAKGQSVPYKLRSGIAQLTGSPLDSSMTPQHMQSIMMSQMGQQMNQKASGAPKKASGSELSQINKVSGMYATAEQSRQMGKK